MNAHPHPEPTIAAWLADGPTSLAAPAREVVRRTIRDTRQRRAAVPWLPSPGRARMLAVVGLALAVGVAIGMAAGSANPTSMPSATPGPTASPGIPPPSAAPSQAGPGRTGTVNIRRPWLTVSFEYEIPEGLSLTTGRGLGTGTWDSAYARFTASRGRHIIVEEVTNAVAHFTNYRPLGTDAASFLQALAANDQFRIGEVATTTLDGRPALTALATSGHWEIYDRKTMIVGSITLGPSSRVIVADIDGAIVLVEIEARSEEELDAWVAEALPFVNSLRFEVQAAR